MSDFIPVKGNSDLVRDPNTDHIINTNKNAYRIVTGKHMFD